MKKNYLLLTLLSMPLIAVADVTALNLSNININKGEEQISLSMDIAPRSFHVRSNDVVRLTPMYVAQDDTIALPSLSLAGKNAWYALTRGGNTSDVALYRAGKGESIAYAATVSFPDEFEYSQLIIKSDTASVCNCRPAKEGSVPVAELDFRKYEPSIDCRFQAPKDSAEKVFELTGRANVIFKVNRTEIDWSYADNKAELNKILKSIDAVKDNKDATVQSINLTGYASPEGSYQNNVRLAKGRTEVVKAYVQSQSSFPADVYHTSYVPEDWSGLKSWLEISGLINKNAMIAFIDNPDIPEASRNDLFKARFPNEYPMLLQNVYPSLRHTDYKITYKVRKYYDVDEIREVMHSNPSNLSLNELFLLANSSGPDSQDYEEAFRVAALLYPDSEVANLNAANAAIQAGRYDEAEGYLNHLPENGEVLYAQGVLALKRGDIAGAQEYFMSASAEGVGDAENALREIDRFINRKDAVTIILE